MVKTRCYGHIPQWLLWVSGRKNKTQRICTSICSGLELVLGCERSTYQLEIDESGTDPVRLTVYVTNKQSGLELK